jgi:hypothetical protein
MNDLPWWVILICVLAVVLVAVLMALALRGGGCQPCGRDMV